MSMEPAPNTGRDDAPVLPPLRRRSLRRKAVYAPSHARLWTTLIFLAVLGACAVLFYRHLTLMPYAITLDGAPLCVLASQAEAEQVLRHLQSEVAPEAPEAVQFQEGTVAIARARHGGTLYSVDNAGKLLDARLTPQVVGAAIVVDGRALVMLASQHDAAMAISAMEEAAARGKSGVPVIRETVMIRDYTQPADAEHPLPVMTPEHAAKELSHPPRPQYHSVKRGESFYAIGQQYGLTVNQIKALNPDVNPGALQPGDIIRLPDIPAPITIVMRDVNE